jgi:NAD(P)-dependent dehydrogenase (short-subunit alcohol dehydrogenase family)
MTSVLQAGNTAVITGASSGIGRAAALYCSEQGMNVWMIDIDTDELDIAHNMAVKCSEERHEKSRTDDDEIHPTTRQIIEARVVNVSNWEAVHKLSDEVFETSGACHFLMNNAGIGLGGDAMTDMDTVHKVMGVNTYGPMHGCLAFVPRMKLQGTESLVVNTGSKQGITMPPGNLTYNISKAALKCYTEGLAHELRETTVKVALLIPGWVNTSILLKSLKAKANAAGEDFDAQSVFFHEDKPAGGAWMPRQVFDYMIQKLDLGSFYIVCPDNDVDCETDKLRMTWTMQDITEDRPPLSRWHPDYTEKFNEYLKANGK